MDAFGSSGRLAGVAGPAPVPREPAGSAATCADHTATTTGSCASTWPRGRTAGSAHRLGPHPNTVDNRVARVHAVTSADATTPHGFARLLAALACP